MLISPASLAAFAVLPIGILVFWSNPHRIINRFFLSFSLQLTAWLFCVHRGVTLGEDPFWVRLASAISAFGPWHMWLIMEACVGKTAADIYRRSIPWVVVGIALVALCYSPWYVTPRPGGGAQFGPGYFVYMLVVITKYALVCRATVRQMRTQKGAIRMDLQILLLGGCAMCFSILFLMALRGVLHALWPIHAQPLIVLIFYAGTVVAITTNRVFDARQITLLGVQKLTLVAVAATLAYGVEWALSGAELPAPLAWFFTAGITLWCAGRLNAWLERSFRFYPEAMAARRAAFVASQRESRLEKLAESFKAILQGWGHTEHVVLAWGAKSALGGDDEALRDGAIVRAMETLRWATPERLARERLTPERERVARYLRTEGLGVVMLSEGPTLATLVGVGVSATRVPFTYPQVMQLLELGSIIESALERAHFSRKAQHAEQLATVGLLGASVAHEIRNPLVTIKSFVQLLPAHYHDQRFRDKFFRLIGDEVTRIDRLTEQLLDLASPRAYLSTRVDLHVIVRATLDLIAAKAAHKEVAVVEQLDADPDEVFTDAAAAKQVLLNLCFNAIQALENKGEGERQLRLSTRRLEQSVEVVIADNGPGIAPEIRARLFEPFQTTKSTGFGLGLAICSDILSHLNATISVDPAEPGTGATFRVNFPCQRLSS